MDKKEMPIRIIVVIAYLLTIFISVFSFVHPYNGRTIAEVASSYPNLFTASDYVNYIWIPIFLLFGGFVFYQLNLHDRSHIHMKSVILYRTLICFIVLFSLITVWIIAWSFDYLALSALIIIVMAICCQYLCRSLCNTDLSKPEKVLIRLPFSFLYGWITFLAVTSMILLFVSIRWKGFGIPIPIWDAATMVGLAVYAAYRTQRNRDIVYSLAIIWGYIGILVKHVSEKELGGQYPQIILVVLLCMVLLVGNAAFLLLFRKKNIM